MDPGVQHECWCDFFMNYQHPIHSLLNWLVDEETENGTGAGRSRILSECCILERKSTMLDGSGRRRSI